MHHVFVRMLLVRVLCASYRRARITYSVRCMNSEPINMHHLTPQDVMPTNAEHQGFAFALARGSPGCCHLVVSPQKTMKLGGAPARITKHEGLVLLTQIHCSSAVPKHTRENQTAHLQADYGVRLRFHWDFCRVLHHFDQA